MAGKRFSIKISSLFPLIIATTFLVTAASAIAFTNHIVRQQALLEAKIRMRLILDRNLSLHTYFSQELKPALFAWSEPFRSADYFDPTWMSSTYALRQINKNFADFSETDYYYKDAAINARSPENEADSAERAYLEELRRNPDTAEYSTVQTLNGQSYLVVMRPGEILEEPCLRCHGDPADAPQGLVDLYGAERSFHREAELGQVISVLSVRVPLTAAYAINERFDLQFAGFLLILACLFIIWYWFQRRVFLEPLNHLRSKAIQIAGSSAYLGEEIPTSLGRELNELTQAFNIMSHNLRQQLDQQEQRIHERTAELTQANQQLQHEIIERQRAEAALHNLSLTDELTGLHNRRGFLLFAEQQLKLARRMQRPALLIFGDMDNLKTINDSLGHAQGDLALMEVATTLKSTFRESDVVARWGGDEFVVLALDAPPNSAENLLQRARHNLETRNAQSDRTPRLTMSLGVSRWDPNAPVPLPELIAHADRSMYQQKNNSHAAD